METLRFKKILLPADELELKKFLCSEFWPFHVNEKLTDEIVSRFFQESFFSGTNNQSYWILNSNEAKIGFLRLFDLEDIGDGYPLFDLRIGAEFRGMGVGKAAVQWLCSYMFKNWQNLDRIAGTTRVDNIAMRKIFRSCGFVKEGHFRKDWSDSKGNVFDTVKYSILREDWITCTTTPVRWDDEP
jgi:RimJ/RimL family protein N-acetyltransferase